MKDGHSIAMPGPCQSSQNFKSESESMLPIDCLSVLYIVFILVESDVSIALWYEIQMFLKFKLHQNCFYRIKLITMVFKLMLPRWRSQSIKDRDRERHPITVLFWIIILESRLSVPSKMYLDKLLSGLLNFLRFLKNSNHWIFINRVILTFSGWIERYF